VWGNELIRDLIEARADVHCQAGMFWYNSGYATGFYTLSPIQVAAFERNTYLAQQLLDHGARINDLPANNQGRTALQAALQDHPKKKDNTQIVKFLLDHGADVNGPAAEDCGVTALQCAVKSRNIENVDLILKKGAYVDFIGPGWGGRTALQAVCENLREESTNPHDINIVKHLLDYGADINVPASDQRGITALQGAAASGNIDCVLLLLERGANVDAPGAKEHGRTALEMAAEHGRLDVVQILVNAFHVEGIKPDCIRARVLAAEEDHLGVVELLESVMATQGDNIPPLPARQLKGFW
jgi:ankyrin repeat protein